jgi:hydrogenase maturation protease
MAVGGERVPSPRQPRRVVLLGLGSVLMGDDAFGPWALKQLEARWELPPEVELLDAGTPGPELGHYLLGLDALVVLDTVRGGGRVPGRVLAYRREQILAHQPAPRMSPHDPSLKDALLTADLAGDPPDEVLLVGVVPERVELGAGLSPAVRAAWGEVEAAVVGELRRLGLVVEPRPVAVAAEVWWEAEATAS